MKVCSKCGVEKSYTEFNKRASSKDGYNVWCKPCKKQYDLEYHEKNRERNVARNRDYKARDPEKWIAYGKEYYLKNKVKFSEWGRANRLMKKYGMSEADFTSLLENQGNRCAICSTDLHNENTHIDHNHNTGEVRGALCGPCNTSLGGFKDSPEILSSAYEYLIERGFYGQKAA